MAPDLVLVFLSSFIGVFVVLIFLALSMYVIMRLFPAKTKVPAETKIPAPDDTPMYAAVISTYAQKFPGLRVTRIEKIKDMKNKR